MTAWATILLAGLATYALRALPARWAGRRPLPEAWQRATVALGPAAFAALAAPAAVLGSGSASPAVARLGAVAVALPLARRTRSTTAVLLAGMSTLWLVTIVAGG
ncbi:MAG: AzlD domain-containing protein [Acidimicrobiales bacterium]|jgi:branched-subunit amino acid transport protein